MVALNISMLSSLSLILGSAKYANNNLQLQQNLKATASQDGGDRECANLDLDPPEAYVDLFDGIPKDDPSLTILLRLQWPRRDFPWFIRAYREFFLPNQRGRRKVLGSETVGIFNTDFENLATSGPTSSPLFTTSGPTSTPSSTTSGPTSTPSSTTSGPTSTPSSTTFTSTSTPSSTTSTSTLTPSSTTFTSTSIPSSTTSTSTSTPPSTTFTSTSTPSSTTFTSTLTPSSTTFTSTSTLSSTTSTSTSTPSSTTSGLNITEEDLLDVESFAAEIEIKKIVKLLGEDTTTEQRNALTAGEKNLEKKDQIEKENFEANITFSSDAAPLMHQLGFRKTDPLSTKMAQGGFILIGATESFTNTFDLPAVSVSGLVILDEIADCSTVIGEFQRPQFEPCFPNNPYRTMDGSCNNLASDSWGATFTPYRRDLHPVYDDGVSTFRRSVTNEELPSARLVSLRINTIRSEESPSFTILHMTFGQFIDHDLIKTPLARGGYGGSVIKCCDIPSFLRPNPECAPIAIPSEDSFYSPHRQTCMEFVRSASIPVPCSLFPREQGNEQTAYLDGSVIYGIRPTQTKDLRTGTCGLLKQQLAEDGQMLLPKESNMADGCNTPEMAAKGRFCFKTGDGRTNEQTYLTFFQTLFAREHNRIANILCNCHEDWDDEKIFQETRRIVWALLQQITFNEYLPTIIGPSLMTSSKLFPLTGNRQTDDYSPDIDASIANNFAAATFRFGHSLIADNVLYVTKHGKTSPIELSTQFFNPFELYQRDAVCDVARGGLNLPGNKMDPYFTPEVAGKLFRGHRPFGLDLLALNIQRGRDHGLPPYNKWREFCGLPLAGGFNDLRNEMTQDRIDALQSVYTNVNDIDLYAGGVSETPVPGAILGHTFTCLVHNQFFRMKYGDRFWFEYRNSPGAFMPEQLTQLHKATLAMVMCNNLPELERIQRYPLKNPGPGNPKVRCQSIRKYNLKPWGPSC